MDFAAEHIMQNNDHLNAWLSKSCLEFLGSWVQTVIIEWYIDIFNMTQFCNPVGSNASIIQCSLFIYSDFTHMKHVIIVDRSRCTTHLCLYQVDIEYYHMNQCLVIHTCYA